MVRKLFILTTLFFLVSSSLVGQEESTVDIAVRDLLEDMAVDGRLTEGGDEAQVLYELAANKLDINSATADELRAIHVLTESQVQTIIYERSRHGSFTSVLDLLSLPEFDEWLVSRLANFIKYEDKAEKKTSHFLKGEFLTRVSVQTPKAKGFSHDVKSPYLGEPLKLLSRNRLSLDDVYSVGAVAESDMGEPICSHGVTFTDFVSGFFSYKKNQDGLARAIVGHYNAHIGQGLGLWSGFAANMTSVQASIDRNVEAITPSLSASESGYLRGVACTLVHNQTYLTLFGSLTDNDASILKTDNDSTEEYIRSIQSDGYHRTQSEINNRNNVRIRILGGYAAQGFYAGKIGLGMNHWQSSKRLNNDGMLDRVYYPKTDNITTYHVDYRLIFSRIKFYGEVALQDRHEKALAAMCGMDLALVGGSYISIAYRDFSRRYYAACQNPFSRWRQPAGERGLYMGAQVSPLSNLSLLTSINMYINRWLTYKCKLPSEGYKFRLNASYEINQNCQLAFKLRADNNKITMNSGADREQTEHRLSYRMQYQASPLPIVRFKGAVEFVTYTLSDGADSKGVWFSQEVKLMLEKCRKLNATLYLAHFDTDNYNSRVYAFMPDMIYSMSTPAFYGKGVVATGMISINPIQSLSVSARIKCLRYLDRDVIGSGNEQTEGNRRTEIKLQLRYKLFHRIG